MTKVFAVAGVMAVGLIGSTATAQDRMSAPREVVAEKVRVEAEQLPLQVKMRMPLEARVVTGAPYSADVVSENIETLADGNRIVQRVTGRVYRDGQGRVRREDEKPGQPPSATIIDPVAGVSYVLDPVAKVAWKTTTKAGGPYGVPGGGVVVLGPSPADPADVERKRIIERKIIEQKIAEQEIADKRSGEKAAAGAVMIRRAPEGGGGGAPRWEQTVEKLPAREVEGVAAEGTRTTRTIPADAIGNERPIVMVTEEWRSNELQVLLLTTSSDPRTGESTYKLLNIVRGEPGAGYFEVPAGYTVRERDVRQEVIIKREPK
jgi:hypothetical protein